MKNIGISSLAIRLSKLFSILILIGLLVLPGCGGGGGPVDPDPQGYFTGTATINNTNYTDVTALSYANRVLIFSPTANVLYDIVKSAPTATYDYTGTVEVYVDGVIEQVGAVTVSGNASALEIAGTFAGGSGFGAGSFDVAFDAGNNKGATFGRIEGRGIALWKGDIFGKDQDIGNIQFSSTGFYIGTDSNNQNCQIGDLNTSVLVIPDSNSNIYKMSHDVYTTTPFPNCVDGDYASTGHTGFAAVVNGSANDNQLVFAFNNDDIALFAIMTRPRQ